MVLGNVRFEKQMESERNIGKSSENPTRDLMNGPGGRAAPPFQVWGRKCPAGPQRPTTLPRVRSFREQGGRWLGHCRENGSESPGLGHQSARPWCRAGSPPLAREPLSRRQMAELPSAGAGLAAETGAASPAPLPAGSSAVAT